MEHFCHYCSKYDNESKLVELRRYRYAHPECWKRNRSLARPTAEQRDAINAYAAKLHKRPARGYWHTIYYNYANYDIVKPLVLRYARWMHTPTTTSEWADLIWRALRVAWRGSTGKSVRELAETINGHLTGEDFFDFDYKQSLRARYDGGEYTEIAEPFPERTVVQPIYCWVCGQPSGYRAVNIALVWCARCWAHDLHGCGDCGYIGKRDWTTFGDKPDDAILWDESENYPLRSVHQASGHRRGAKRCNETAIYKKALKAIGKGASKRRENVLRIIRNSAHTEDVYNLVRLFLELEDFDHEIWKIARQQREHQKDRPTN